MLSSNDRRSSRTGRDMNGTSGGPDLAALKAKKDALEQKKRERERAREEGQRLREKEKELKEAEEQRKREEDEKRLREITAQREKAVATKLMMRQRSHEYQETLMREHKEKAEGKRTVRAISMVGLQKTVLAKSEQFQKAEKETAARFATVRKVCSVDTVILTHGVRHCLQSLPHEICDAQCEEGICPAGPFQAFVALDTNGDGIISASDLKSRLASYGCHYSRNSAQEMIDEVLAHLPVPITRFTRGVHFAAVCNWADAITSRFSLCLGPWLGRETAIRRTGAGPCKCTSRALVWWALSRMEITVRIAPEGPRTVWPRCALSAFPGKRLHGSRFSPTGAAQATSTSEVEELQSQGWSRKVESQPSGKVSCHSPPSVTLTRSDPSFCRRVCRS